MIMMKITSDTVSSEERARELHGKGLQGLEADMATLRPDKNYDTSDENHHHNNIIMFDNNHNTPNKQLNALIRMRINNMHSQQ